ncbi:acyl-CoA dehydrogenase family protein [uncultured Georgenia sp.]|uniref:acyl-CoA dehydrogenase family protein n=1 Tax=uncultured Georgenia sp. TaxID=378209 RepID=UPI0026351603|nr:acyl-CoA dehydrogenase family protein [uncultured Georgenia sp.]
MTGTVDLSMTEEQVALVAAVRDFAASALAPYANERDAQKHFPLEALRAAGEMGLGAVYVREDVGGSGLTRRDAVALFEELGHGDTTLAAYISIHNMVAWMIDQYGGAEQRARWLPRLATMEDLGAYCLTEPGVGSDAAALTTSARRDGEEYVLTGTKQFISGAGSAAVHVVMARTGGPGPDGISAIVVPAGAAGLSFGPLERKMGWNAQPTRQVVLDEVRVPVSNRLGEAGAGFTIAMKALNSGRANIAAVSVGGARWALERAARYVQEREAFAAPLATHQSVVFRLADMETELHAARLLVRRAAERIDAGAPDEAVACAMAKRFATDTAFDVANAALQLHGGYGYLHEYGVERVVRDLRVHQILEGTNEIMRLIIGRDVLRRARRRV